MSLKDDLAYASSDGEGEENRKPPPMSQARQFFIPTPKSSFNKNSTGDSKQSKRKFTEAFGDTSFSDIVFNTLTTKKKAKPTLVAPSTDNSWKHNAEKNKNKAKKAPVVLRKTKVETVKEHNSSDDDDEVQIVAPPRTMSKRSLR
ncbi:hypothetical protein SEMRO_231_G093720.1 [Seminavis robusta]|uniref:Uncharacterized protein n=1 Tax=Seminavis robusta TaxID=568900 RepID=A0A9N8HCS9_9STRA|nr:hypothetical protein SEMRO_231_G093720.1 [Seminavis robusta]|eukprot:Sro231_g093720.1 n/a (145) ;mRNA; f:78949-79383